MTQSHSEYYKERVREQSREITSLKDRAKMLGQELYHCGMSNKELRSEAASLKCQLEQAQKLSASEFSKQLKKWLVEISKGEPETFGFVAAFMDGIDKTLAALERSKE
jgi:chromosome segregation ATPase